MLLDQVAAFTAFAGNGGSVIRRLPCLIGKDACIGGLVQSVTGVVEHAAVNGHIVPHTGDVLDVPHSVQSDARFAHDGTAWLNENIGQI